MNMATPFLTPHAQNLQQARRTLEKLGGLDARADALTIGAHDLSVEGRSRDRDLGLGGDGVGGEGRGGQGGQGEGK